MTKVVAKNLSNWQRTKLAMKANLAKAIKERQELEGRIESIHQFLWDNELVTWSDDMIMTEEINNIFINAAMEN